MPPERPPGLRRLIADQTATFIAGGLGLVAALAWNDAIRALFDRLFASARGGLIAQFAYAALITVIVVFLTVRVFKRSDAP